MFRNTWCWVPGTYVRRPVYAPALVGWVGGPHVSVSIAIGGGRGPGVGWFPLAPREVFVPGYRVSPRYVREVNVTHVTNITNVTTIIDRPDTVVRGIDYRNRRFPHAVTVVPQAVMESRQPVAPAAARWRNTPAAREFVNRPAQTVALPAAPVTAPPAVDMRRRAHDEQRGGDPARPWVRSAGKPTEAGVPPSPSRIAIPAMRAADPDSRAGGMQTERRGHERKDDERKGGDRRGDDRKADAPPSPPSPPAQVRAPIAVPQERSSPAPAPAPAPAAAFSPPPARIAAPVAPTVQPMAPPVAAPTPPERQAPPRQRAIEERGRSHEQRAPQVAPPVAVAPAPIIQPQPPRPVVVLPPSAAGREAEQRKGHGKGDGKDDEPRGRDERRGDGRGEQRLRQN